MGPKHIPRNGANGVGTVIAESRPLQLMCAEHFAKGGQSLACTGAPIRDAAGRVSGVLVAISDYRQVRPALLGLVMQSALQIEERNSGSPTHSRPRVRLAFVRSEPLAENRADIRAEVRTGATAAGVGVA